MTRPPAPIPKRAYLLANDSGGIANALKIKPEPGFFDVICHGDETGFSLKISGKWVDVSPSTLVDAMKRAGYEGGPVRLIACDTGTLSEGAAQQVADIIQDTVKAPTGKVWALDNGGMDVFKAIRLNGRWLKIDRAGWTLCHPTLPATPVQ